MKPKRTPDMATVLDVTDPRRAMRDRQEALAGLHRPTPPMFFEAARGAGEASEASPWAKDGARAEIDKAELPSATMPAAQAEDRPVTKPASPLHMAQRRWPKTWKLVGSAGLVAVLAAPVTLLVLEWRTRESTGKTAASGHPTASATGVAQVASAAVPAASSTAVPAASSAKMVAPAPTVLPRPPHKTRPAPEDARAAPPLTATAAPVLAADTADTAATATPPAKSPTEDKPVF